VTLKRRPRRSDVYIVKYQVRCEWCALKEDDEEKTRGSGAPLTLDEPSKSGARWSGLGL